MEKNKQTTVIILIIIALIGILVYAKGGFLFSVLPCTPGQTKCCNSANSYCQDGTGNILFRCEPFENGGGIWVNRGLQPNCSSYSGPENITYSGVEIETDPSTCQGLTLVSTKTLGSYDEDNRGGEGVCTHPCYPSFYIKPTIMIVYDNYNWRSGYANTLNGGANVCFQGQTVKCYTCDSAQTTNHIGAVSSTKIFSYPILPDPTSSSPTPCKYNWIDCSQKQKGSCNGYWKVSGNEPNCNCQWNCVTSHWNSKVVDADVILGYGGLQWILSACRTNADCPAFKKNGINYEVGCDSGLMLERKIGKLIENSNSQIGNFNRNCVTNRIVTGSAMGNLGNILYGDANCWSDAFAKVRNENIDVSQIQGFCIAHKSGTPRVCTTLHPTNTCGEDSCGMSYDSCNLGYTCKNKLCTSDSVLGCNPTCQSGFDCVSGECIAGTPPLNIQKIEDYGLSQEIKTTPSNNFLTNPVTSVSGFSIQLWMILLAGGILLLLILIGRK